MALIILYRIVLLYFSDLRASLNLIKNRKFSLLSSASSGYILAVLTYLKLVFCAKLCSKICQNVWSNYEVELLGGSLGHYGYYGQKPCRVINYCTFFSFL